MSEQKSAAELAAEVKRDFETKHDKVKEIAEKALADAAKGVEMSGTVKELADQAIIGMNEATATMVERLGTHDKPGAALAAPGH